MVGGRAPGTTRRETTVKHFVASDPTGARLGRRAFVCGAAAAAGVAALALAGCGETDGASSANLDEGTDSVAPSMEANAGGDEVVTLLNEVEYPVEVPSTDYEEQQAIDANNPLDEEFTAGLTMFAEDLACYGLSQAEPPEGQSNSCLSPVGLYLALALLAQGATGNTQTQLLDALGMADIETLASQCGNLMRVLWSHTTPGDDPTPSVLQVANSLWALAEAPLEKPFLETATSDFYAEAYDVMQPGPVAARMMGTWIADHTGSTLKPEVVLPENWLMSLISTLWLKDSWVHAFNENDTTSGTFHAQAGDVTCDFMTQVLEAPAVSTESYTVAALPLTMGGEVTFVLPAEGVDPRSLLARATGNSALFDLSGEDALRARVTYTVPKLSFDANTTLQSVLMAMGVSDIFEDDAAFGGLSEAPLYVSSVEQGTHFAMNEMGIEASSYTKVDMVATSLEPEPVEDVALMLDRPFVFRITAPNGVVLFVGIVGDPTQG